MLFNSLPFAVFLPTVLALLAVAPRGWRNRVLLVASYVFYAGWDARFCLLLAFTTAVDFLCAGRIAALPAAEKVARKRWLLASLVANLSVLGFFKYFNFFAESAVDFLRTLGIEADGPAFRVILPVGISFFTFQSLSYTVDVYRRRIRPASSILDYALYVSLFPQLVAGPIERANQLLPQVLGDRRTTADDVREGLLLISWGFVKKLVVADNLGSRVDRIFALESPDAGQVLLGLVAFAFQIYADFSGYTDIARGCGRLLGFRFALNFEQPFFSRNPPEFWRRWHISLSTWLRDYLFVPLGGISPFPRRVAAATLATMLLGGLWHGASWNFVLWGLYHGLLLVGYQLWRSARPAALRDPRIADHPVTAVLSSFLLFAFVLYGMLLFRAGSLAQIADFTAVLATGAGGAPDLLRGLVRMAPYIGLVLAWDAVAYATRDELWLRRLPPAFTVLFHVFAVYACVVLGVLGGERFIYFDF